MSKTYLISDTHFGHKNIISFLCADGSRLRPFSSIQEHDDFIISRWNSVVKPEDKVYHLGDVGLTNGTQLIQVLSKLNGTKILIKGNHDNLKLSQYQQVFKDIRASHTLDGFVLSHIPIHEYSLSRWKANIHGHLHATNLNDSRYINVSCEGVNYTPVDFEFIRNKFNGN